MNLFKRILMTAAGAAMATGLTAGAAQASTTAASGTFNQWPVTARTWVSTPDVPGNGGVWAGESVLRTATVSGGYPVAPSYCGETWGPCFAYTATVHDQGAFRTYRHALTPNQDRPGRRIYSVVSGNANGNANFGTFYATTRPDANLVPAFFRDGFGAAATWPELFFPHGTTFGVSIGQWSATYSAWTACGPQRWTDASWNGHGNLPWDGNITGCFFFRHHWEA